MPSIAKWYQCMYTYVTALMIVGGRLSAGLLLNHITVMGQVLEQLSLKRDVAFKDAFLVCCLFPWFACFVHSACAGLRYGLPSALVEGDVGRLAWFCSSRTNVRHRFRPSYTGRAREHQVGEWCCCGCDDDEYDDKYWWWWQGQRLWQGAAEGLLGGAVLRVWAVWALC
jgi:hypothetical protein